MSSTQNPDPQFTARQARQITKGFAAQLAGKERGADPTVRRESFDIGDRRARVFRPIGDGTKAGAMSWIDCILKVARDYDDLERAKGGARPLGHSAIAVLEVMLGRRGRKRIPVDFRTGRLDPMIDTIAEAVNLARITVVRALARLKAKGFLSWVRRTVKTDRDGEFAPQRRQTSNAYFFDLASMPRHVRQRLRDLVEARRRSRERWVTAVPIVDEPAASMNADLRAALKALGNRLSRASTTSSPAIPHQG